MKKIFFLLGTVLLCCALQAQTAVNIYQDCSQNGDTIDLRATGLQVIDMGLSVKWANLNIGATAPEEAGSYFAWGETMPKENYDLENYKYCHIDGPLVKYLKYFYDKSSGNMTRTTLELEDDAAYMNWGGNWRMPTKAEWEELLNNCTWAFLLYNGIYGCLLTSNINGNQIFLPASGYYSYGSEVYDLNSSCSYWSSNILLQNGDGNAVSFYCESNRVDILDGYNRSRHSGLPVRAVCP